MPILYIVDAEMENITMNLATRLWTINQQRRVIMMIAIKNFEMPQRLR